ncbi:DNA modification methylase [Microbacterium sp. DT81.1]|uniref:DNA modification methylase n=1 Tax=Microbacterium sp. DT81.1 TaxID=3393413 RepID=UPI003CF7E091
MKPRLVASLAPRQTARAPRLMASVAIGATVILGTAGCSMVSTQATTIGYSPSDGVSVPDSGPLLVRNALIVADEGGTEGNFLAAIINTTDEAQELRMEYGDDSTATVRVGPGETVSLGAEDEDPLLLEDLDALPGSTIEIYFQSGDDEGVLQEVPVLDGSLPYLAPFEP